MPLKKSVVFLVAGLLLSLMSLNCLAQSPDTKPVVIACCDLLKDIKIALIDFFLGSVLRSADLPGEPVQGEPPPEPDLGISIDPRS